MSSTTSSTLTDTRRRELLAERETIAQHRFKLPDAQRFDELFELIAVWDHKRFTHVNGVRSEEYPTGEFLVGSEVMPDFGKRARRISIEIGPFCNVNRQPTNERYGLAVKPTKVVLDELAGWVMHDPNESWSFEIIDHGEVALVIAQNSLILSSVWLAYIDPSTIPADTR